MADNPIGTDTETQVHFDYGDKECAATVQQRVVDGRPLPPELVVQDLAGGAAARYALGSSEAARVQRRVPAVQTLVDNFKPATPEAAAAASGAAPAEFDYDKLAAALSKAQTKATNG
jgi:hypothetical protein